MTGLFFTRADFFTAHVMALPAIAYRAFIKIAETLIEVGAAVPPGFIICLELFVVIQHAQFWLDLFQLVMFDQSEETKWFIAFKLHNAGLCELPVHCEGEWQPIRFHKTRQRRDAMLWPVWRA